MVEVQTVDSVVGFLPANRQQSEAAVAVTRQIAVIVEPHPQSSLAVFGKARDLEMEAGHVGRFANFVGVITQRFGVAFPFQYSTVVHRADPDVAA